jgi:serine protease Do/serine protease DegQ
VVIADPLADFVHGEHIHDYFTGALLADLVDDSNLGRLPAVGVGRVQRDSTAWRLGLRAGDVILEANRQRVEDLQDLAVAARGARGTLILRVRRGDRLLWLGTR